MDSAKTNGKCKSVQWMNTKILADHFIEWPISIMQQIETNVTILKCELK